MCLFVLRSKPRLDRCQVLRLRTVGSSLGVFSSPEECCRGLDTTLYVLTCMSAHAAADCAGLYPNGSVDLRDPSYLCVAIMALTTLHALVLTKMSFGLNVGKRRPFYE